MVTRSIVGRFLILAVLLVSLGVIAQAAIYISKDSGKKVAKADPAPASKTPAAAMTALAPPSSGAAAAVATTPVATGDAAPIRVVYPGPLGDAPAPRKIAEAAPASPLPNPASPPPVTTGPIAAAVAPAAAAPAVPAAPAPAAPQPATAPPAKPAPVVIASADPTAGTPADPAVAAKGGVNLNSASVEALNHLGGGHIGQTIVKHRPYASVEDLVKKRVVRRSVYEQIKNQVAAE